MNQSSAPDLERQAQIVVVGGGPSGASAAYWLAMRGLDVVVIERKHFPRNKACGDGLTPRAVVQLEAMGLAEFLNSQHRCEGLRAIAYGKRWEIPWPFHPDYPSYGYNIGRASLDQAVLQRAEAVGASVLYHHDAIAAEVDDGSIRAIIVNDIDTGATIRIRSDYVILAEGSNSRLSRSLGAARDLKQPLGLAIRGYYATPRSNELWIESHMDLRDESGSVIPGYGWIFPMGNGLANVGFGILSNRNRWRQINTTTALQRFVDHTQDEWGFDKAETSPIGGKLPMGFTISPIAGANYVMVGDAAGSINPFNGEGISYGYETGRIAAGVLTRAIATGDSDMLQRYPTDLKTRYGGYYALARAFIKLISEPKIMGPGVWLAMRSPATMAPMVAAMSNLMRGGTPHQISQLYRLTNSVKDKLGTHR
ncbi:MAG: geranylgeranyl reductase family protein [Ferrimicrobium sp.]